MLRPLPNALAREATGRHFQLGVMRTAALTRDVDRRQGLAVFWGFGVRVKDGEKVAACLRIVTGPDEKV